MFLQHKGTVDTVNIRKKPIGLGLPPGREALFTGCRRDGEAVASK